MNEPLVNDPHENQPGRDDPAASDRQDSLSEEEILKALHERFPYDVPEYVEPEEPVAPARTVHPYWPELEPLPTGPRTPNFGDVGMLGTLLIVGFLGSGMLARAALHFHLWGLATAQQAANDIHYTIGTIAAIYVIGFGFALILFPLVWRRGFFTALQWNAASASQRIVPLLGAAGACFVLALVDEAILPGPAKAPIDQLFDSRAAAWVLFGFGVTVAPFFEELIFRGFLLPALCTAFDWTVERATRIPPPPLDPEGYPRWSLGAMAFASFATSIPFALMHAEQTAWSLGPFLLLVCVSLVLCWARLASRSLAASVLVHAAYNFMLFSLMLWGTGGFRHLDNM
jgi:hypothetical protein